MLKNLAALILIGFVCGGIYMIGRAQLAKVEEQPETNSSSALLQQKIADEAEIRRVVDEIDNAVDAKDSQKARSYFTDDITVDFVSLAGGQPAKIKADELISGWRTNLYADKKSHHQRSNHRITINGDRAEVFSKGYAFNLLEKGEVTGLWEVWGDYKHSLERTKQGWKVSSMTLLVTHKRGDDRVRTFVPTQK